MGEVSTIGLDIAKSVFQVHGVDDAGTVVIRKRVSRAKVLEFFAELPPCLVGIEACPSPSPSFGPSPLLRLIRPLLTSRSAGLLDHRHPFRRKARSPQVRTSAFAARPPDLRRLALVTRASRLHARLPCSALPLIRFLFVGPQFRSPLPSRRPHGTTLCGSLRSL